jgi:hypothetical protein
MTLLHYTKTAPVEKRSRSIALFFTLFLFFLFTACSNNNSSLVTPINSVLVLTAQPTDAAGEANPEKKTILTSNDLYTLYIENREGNEQLKKLLGDNQKQKLIFQLYRAASGYLQLMAFPSTNGNSKYFINDAVELSRSNIKDITMPEGENIFFGDLQVANRPGLQKYTIRDLKAHLYDANKPGQNAGWEYILLVPKILDVKEESYRRKYIVYELKRSDEMPQVSSKKASLAIISLNDEANPSPPRKME